MRRIKIVCAVALVVTTGCSSTPRRVVELPTGERITLIPTYDGDEAVLIPCEWYQEAKCRRRMRYICDSEFTVLFFDVGQFSARCWNQHLPWVENAGIYACSNGGTTNGDVRIERQANGIDIAFAKRARVNGILELLADNDPAFRYVIGDDWVDALCWGGVRSTGDVMGFLRYLRNLGVEIERTDDGAFNLRRAYPH